MIAVNANSVLVVSVVLRELVQSWIHPEDDVAADDVPNEGEQDREKAALVSQWQFGSCLRRIPHQPLYLEERVSEERQAHEEPENRECGQF